MRTHADAEGATDTGPRHSADHGSRNVDADGTTTSGSSPPTPSGRSSIWVSAASA